MSTPYTWYSPYAEEMAIIRQFAESAPDSKDMVEIGCYSGVTTQYLATNFPYRTLIAIDPWDNSQDGSGENTYQEFLHRTRDCSNVHVLRKKSQDAVKNVAPMGFVFHDGDHTDIDFREWYEKLAKGGVMIVHDIFDEGWPKVREEWLKLPNPKIEIRVHIQDKAKNLYSRGPRGLGVIVKT